MCGLERQWNAVARGAACFGCRAGQVWGSVHDMASASSFDGVEVLESQALLLRDLDTTPRGLSSREAGRRIVILNSPTGDLNHAE